MQAQNAHGNEYLNAAGDSSGSGSKVFNEMLLNGQKAVLTERINAAIYEKI